MKDYSYLNHISDQQVQQDLDETQAEIEELQERLKTYVPGRSSQDNLGHFMIKRNIKKREEFISQLKELQEWRKAQTETENKT